MMKGSEQIPYLSSYLSFDCKQLIMFMSFNDDAMVKYCPLRHHSTCHQGRDK